MVHLMLNVESCQISLKGSDTSHYMTKAVYWMKRAGLALPLSLLPIKLQSDADVTRFWMHFVESEETLLPLQKLVREVGKVKFIICTLLNQDRITLVIALDINPTRLALARHNAAIYGVADRIDFILADYLTFIGSYLSLPSGSTRKIDVIFLSPPWGGPSYLSGLATMSALPSVESLQGSAPSDTHPEYSLASIQPIHGAKLFELTRQVTCNIAYFLPRNTSLEELSTLLTKDFSSDEVIEIEEEWMGTKLKALTCYFGGLAGGQEHLF